MERVQSPINPKYVILLMRRMIVYSIINVTAIWNVVLMVVCWNAWNQLLQRLKPKVICIFFFSSQISNISDLNIWT